MLLGKIILVVAILIAVALGIRLRAIAWQRAREDARAARAAERAAWEAELRKDLGEE